MKIDTELMQSAASQISGGAGQLESQIANFKSIVTNLTSSGWVAPSGTAFQGAFDKWNAAAVQMHEAILMMSKDAGVAGQNFSGADASSTIH